MSVKFTSSKFIGTMNNPSCTLEEFLETLQKVHKATSGRA